MLQIFIGPNGFGKTTKLIEIKKKLDNQKSNNTNDMINSGLKAYKHYMFNKTIEEEIKYEGLKNSTVEYFEHLDNFNDFDKYAKIIS